MPSVRHWCIRKDSMLPDCKGIPLHAAPTEGPLPANLQDPALVMRQKLHVKTIILASKDYSLLYRGITHYIETPSEEP